MNGNDKRHRVLGRGLSSLLPPRPPQGASEAPTVEPIVSALSVDVIQPNPMQPRSVFHPDRMAELADSIRVNGIIQPLIVRKAGDLYQIVAGERRWRAAKIVGLATVPVVVQEIDDAHMLEIALIENLQREDLNPIETAHAYQRLMREVGLSHEDISRRTGKDRSSILNTIRLLKLAHAVQTLIAEHRISMGHARAILGLTEEGDQVRVAEKAAEQGLSVRHVESLVQELTSDRPPRTGFGPRKDIKQDPNIRAAVEQLERVLGTRVRIVEVSDER